MDFSVATTKELIFQKCQNLIEYTSPIYMEDIIKSHFGRPDKLK